MNNKDFELAQIWRQKEIPVVFRQSGSNPLLIKLPFDELNFHFLRNGNTRKPTWNDKFKCWETPLAWFESLVGRIVRKYSAVYLIQVHREQQKCASACWNAKGFHCECSCMGANHGSGHPHGKWHEISETFAFHWQEKQYACRLIRGMQ